MSRLLPTVIVSFIPANSRLDRTEVETVTVLWRFQFHMRWDVPTRYGNSCTTGSASITSEVPKVASTCYNCSDPKPTCCFVDRRRIDSPAASVERSNVTYSHVIAACGGCQVGADDSWTSLGVAGRPQRYPDCVEGYAMTL